MAKKSSKSKKSTEKVEFSVETSEIPETNNRPNSFVRLPSDLYFKGLESSSKYLREKWLRGSALPTIFCPGCGLGNIMNMLTRALEATQIQKNKLVLISGIGCTARIPGYFDVMSMNTTHGRAIPIATAIKMTNPELNVIVISGDGDLIGIGGNHFLHALRRNVGIKVICANNFTYGMTGGQVSPTSPLGSFSTSYPWGGNPETEMDIAKLAAVGGAPYVVRWTTYQWKEGIKSITKALLKPGFSFLEFISPCPTNFGRRNNVGNVKSMQNWIRDNTEVMKIGTNPVHHEYFIDYQYEKIQLGKFQELDRPTFETIWLENCKNAKKKYIEEIKQTKGGNL